MESDPAFTRTEDDLLPILHELQQKEPIFHSPEFGTSAEDYDARMAADYWEVGASGRRYSRDFILNELRGKAPAFAHSLGWQSWDHALRRLGAETYLLTYVLKQGDRLSRRATIWQHSSTGWMILYHQGTLLSDSESH